MLLVLWRCLYSFRFFLDQESHPGARVTMIWCGGSMRSGRGSGVEELGSAAGLRGGVWEGAGDCNGLVGGRSGRGRLDV